MKRSLAGFLPAAAFMSVVAGTSLGVVVLGSGAAQGQNQPPSPGSPGGPGGIPEEAFAACEGRAVDDACPIIAPDGEEVIGQCAPAPAPSPTPSPTPDATLACVPEGHQPPPRN